MDLQYESRIEHGATERNFLRLAFPGCEIRRTAIDEDKAGADYFVSIGRYRHGVDFKRRRAGTAQFWKDRAMPELPLELRSGSNPGWAVERHPATDYFAFVFDDLPSLCYLIAAEELVNAVVTHPSWQHEYPTGESTSVSDYWGKRWKSRCVFVPVDTVLAALPEGSYMVL